MDNFLSPVITKSGFVIIAGPCVLEDQAIVIQIAEELKRLSLKYEIPLIFKASYEKANRSSIKSPVGPGIEKGLEQLADIKAKFNLPLLTDIHNPEEAATAARVVDILQIPAFLSRQTALLVAAGETGKIINIKKGQFLAADDMKLAADKVASTGNNKIFCTERGNFFGYHDLVVDFRNLFRMKELGLPVIFDATHSLQKPGGEGSEIKVSGGHPEMVIPMAAAATATGALNGIFFETHPSPLKAKSDAASMLPLERAENLFRRIKSILNTI